MEYKNYFFRARRSGSEIIKEFNNLWNSDYALDFETFYEIYKVRYELIKHQREEAKKRYSSIV